MKDVLLRTATIILVLGLFYLTFVLGLRAADQFICRNVSVQQYDELDCSEVLK